MKMTTNCSISLKYVCDNEEWLGVMDEGQEAPEVTGGMIDLPQGGKRASKAAVTGGVFLEGSESGSLAFTNTMKMAETLFPVQITDVINDNGLDSLTMFVSSAETFFTNLMKQELIKIRTEYSDNPDEQAATDQVINSVRAVVEITGAPTMEEITNLVAEEIQKQLGGAGK